jgi:hypothetical protein
MPITPPAVKEMRLRAGIDRTLLVHDEGLRDLYQKLLPLLESCPEPGRRKIGFGSRDEDQDEDED